MKQERLSETDIRVLSAILPAELSAGRLAATLGRSPSTISESIRRLRQMRLVETGKKGMTVIVRPSAGPLMNAIALLIKEGPGRRISKLLTGSGLAILPLLLSPGSTSQDIMGWASLSQATVRGRLRLWRGMGVVVRDPKTGMYKFARGQEALAVFAQRYSETQNQRILDNAVPGAIILWQDRSEFLFSADAGTWVNGFAPAGPGALEALGYDIAHSRDYYEGGRAVRNVPLEEALVQTVLIERANPRARRWISEGLKGRRIDRGRLMAFARKYKISDDIGKLLEALDGKEKVRPR